LKEANPINWKEIDSLISEGYSDIAIAKLAGTNVIVVQEYRKSFEEGG